MNGLVLSNNVLWMYFFFEVTTLCSFMLIGHDATEIATRNSVRALWMNAMGGLAFVLGMMLVYMEAGTLNIAAILGSGNQTALMLTGLGFLCLAGFTKAAQVPFQSWLLGAMVAPTPVSALLHSSTMVKAGVFVVLRFAPAYAGSFLSTGVAVCGAFTFIACSALGVGQSNGKKILAYSTVANLGLIICCAGINTPLALTAAVMLILFHAISKSLLFLCVGTIEQAIGSRDIEDMRGLYARLPRTALITIIGILTMMLPPFGVLLGKWMAIEASADSNIFIVVMLAMGSALMVVFLARWAGSMMATREEGGRCESQPTLIRLPLLILCLGAVVLSIASPWIYNSLLAPWLGSAPFVVGFGSLESAHGTFVVVPLFLVLGLGLLYAVKAGSGYRKVKVMPPYLGGANSSVDGTYVGPMNGDVPFAAGNMYLGELFAEGKTHACLQRTGGRADRPHAGRGAVMETLILVILGLLVGPLAGGLIAGLDRRVTAWFQSRQGPPIMQAFYDVAKLLGKEKMVVNQWQIICAWVYLIAAATSVALFFAQGDLLLVFFVQAVGAVFLVMGAMAAKSPYSQVGAQRELMQILAYEPILILVFVGFYMVTGSFSIEAIWAQDMPLLAKMPLLYLALGYALTIKLRKSPFDFSTSHHGHQELVKGMLTEYSGPYLALIEIAHWYEDHPGARPVCALLAHQRGLDGAAARGHLHARNPGGQHHGPHDLALDAQARLAARHGHVRR